MGLRGDGTAADDVGGVSSIRGGVMGVHGETERGAEEASWPYEAGSEVEGVCVDRRPIPEMTTRLTMGAGRGCGLNVRCSNV